MRGRRALALLLVVSAGWLTGGSCAAPARLAIVLPADRSQADASGDVPVEIDLGAALGAGGTLRANLLGGIDGGGTSIVPVPLAIAGATATAMLGAADLFPGRSSLFVSIDRDGDGRPESTVSSTFSWEPDLDVENADRCDILDPAQCILPFPSNHLTKPDVGTDTHLRVNIALESMPSRYDGKHVDPTELNRNDGFSPGANLITAVPGIDLAQSGAPLITKIARSLDADSPVVLIDATSGERQLVWAEMDPLGEDLLLLRVGKNLENGHRYIAALRRLENAAGETLPAGRAFQIYRDRILTFLPAVEDRRAAMERVFSDLARAGIARNDLHLAWDFTIISTRNMSERMLAMRDDAFASLNGASPSFTVTKDEAFTDTNGPGGATRQFRRVTGSVSVPLYLTGSGAPGSRLRQGPGGLPTRDTTQAFATAFRCTIPDGLSGADPARPVLYGHGLLGDEGEVGARNIRDITTAYGFTVRDEMGGMSKDDTKRDRHLGNLALPDTRSLHRASSTSSSRPMKHPQGSPPSAFQDAQAGHSSTRVSSSRRNSQCHCWRRPRGLRAGSRGPCSVSRDELQHAPVKRRLRPVLRRAGNPVPGAERDLAQHRAATDALGSRRDERQRIPPHA
jgi:hypothetical protein